MGPLKSFAKETGLVAAATMGAGIFALPYVFFKAGWLTGLFYLIVLAAILISIHSLYFRVLEKVKEKNRLLGLVRGYLGNFWFAVGLVAILGGLCFALVAYLILGSQFLRLLFIGLPPAYAVLLFWLGTMIALTLKERRSSNLEMVGVVLVASIIIFIFATADFARGSLSELGAFYSRSALLPFGVLLFALAGWTSVEPVFDNEKASKSNLTPKTQPYLAFTAGTAIVALFYLMFVMGILGSTGTVAPDTLSALSDWPRYKVLLLAALGLFALWTSYLPIGLEIKHSLEKDLRLPWWLALGAVMLAPLIFVFAGLNNFASVVGLVGGVFLSLQYFLMVLVGKNVLDIRGVKRLLLNLVSLLFILAAVYEIYYFLRRF